MAAIRTAGSGTRQRLSLAQMPYINRELSWLGFNNRVLYEAVDERNPARAGSVPVDLRRQPRRVLPGPGGWPQAARAGGPLEPDARRHERWRDARSDRSCGCCRCWRNTPRRGTRCATSSPNRVSASSGTTSGPSASRAAPPFLDEIFPVLTPLAVDPGHPFPYISDLSLSLAVTVRDPLSGEQRFARIKVPPVLPRLVEVGPRHTS